MPRDHDSAHNGTPQQVRTVVLIGIGIVIGVLMGGFVSGLPSLQAQSSSPLTIQPDTGRVGIGTTAPGEKLHVVGSGAAAARVLQVDHLGVTLSSYINGAIAAWGTVSNHPFRIMTSATERLSIDTAGNVGIGTASPAAKLHVAGTAKIDNWASESLAQNGYARVGSVLQQWGYSPAGSGFFRTITLPTPFANASYIVVASVRLPDGGPAGSDALAVTKNYTTTSFAIETRCSLVLCDYPATWIAIGQ